MRRDVDGGKSDAQEGYSIGRSKCFQATLHSRLPAAYRSSGGHETVRVDFLRHLALPLIATHSVEFNDNR